jgi:hypothetical protein
MFKVFSFYANHSGAFGYQREAARPYFEKSHEVYRALYKRRWRGGRMTGNELAFGIAASGLSLPRMLEPFPICWPEEMKTLDLTKPGLKPLVHFIGGLPDETLDTLMQDVAQRRHDMNLSGTAEPDWRAKAARSARGVAAREILDDLRLKKAIRIAKLKFWATTPKPLQPPTTLRASPMPITKPASGKSPTKLYYHHLMKCGGTSLNTWLLTHFPDYGTAQRELQLQAYGRHKDETIGPLRERNKLRSFATDALAELDCLLDHAPLAHFTPAGTVRITCLRESRSRLVSHCKDWRRYSSAQVENEGTNMRDGLRLLHSGPLKEFLETTGRKAGAPFHFVNNYMTRSLAENRVGVLASGEMSAAKLLPIALEVLHESFDVVGVLEDQMSFRSAIARRMQWCPASLMPALNTATAQEVTDEEVEDAADIIGELTRFDDMLYAEAKVLSAAATDDNLPWDSRTFDETAAADKLSTLVSKTREGFDAFDFDGPVFASGHQGRVKESTTNQLRLNTAENLTLYIPTPADADIEVAIWLEGLVTLDLLDSMELRIDDQVVIAHAKPSSFSPLLVTTGCRTTRSFVKLELLFAVREFDSPLYMSAYGWAAK